MIKKNKVLGIILARGGSKRILKKNTKLLLGKPLIAYTIEAAKASKYIDRLILSSDDQEAIAIAKNCGVEVPFVRPAELAGEFVGDFPVIKHVIQWLEENENYQPEIIVQLRPTSPLRTTEQINIAIELLASHPEIDSVRTVTRPDQSPYKMYTLDSVGLLQPLLSLPGRVESFNMPEQELPKVYKHVGYVDVMWKKTIIEQKSLTGKKIFPLILENAVSGINTADDWQYYEYLLKNKK